MPRGSKTRRAPPSQVRIIGGQWRGRRLPVPGAAGLRPTKDAVRETLFNWLQPILPGSRCLDVFAGSGALGFEAASRGASAVIMLEQSAELCAGLREQARRLDASTVEIVCCNAERYLHGTVQAPGPFDIVFLDPPFDAVLLPDTCRLLAGGGWLRLSGRVYLETARQAARPAIPDGWRWLHQKTAGDVAYGLAEVTD